MVQVGQAAPPFRGEAYTNGRIGELTSDQLRGRWVVLFFYALDFTFV